MRKAKRNGRPATQITLVDQLGRLAKSITWAGQKGLSGKDGPPHRPSSLKIPRMFPPPRIHFYLKLIHKTRQSITGLRTSVRRFSLARFSHREQNAEGGVCMSVVNLSKS
jgi:hypothetical protein